MRDYKKIEVWKKAHLLTKHVYKNILPLMPEHESFALTSQIKRSSYSIPMNIVEGCGRNTDKDFAHFLDNALGSALEVEYTSYLIFDLEFINQEQYDTLNLMINEVKAMLIAFINFLRKGK